jgi:hypothetical protein
VSYFHPPPQHMLIYALLCSNGTWNEEDLAIIEDVLQRFQLASFSTEAKLNGVCLMFNESCKENIKSESVLTIYSMYIFFSLRLKDELKNMLAQMEKQEQTKEALKNLINALRNQVTLVREEGELKLKEETQRRIDCSKKFEDTMKVVIVQSTVGALIQVRPRRNCPV